MEPGVVSLEERTRVARARRLAEFRRHCTVDGNYCILTTLTTHQAISELKGPVRAQSDPAAKLRAPAVALPAGRRLSARALTLERIGLTPEAKADVAASDPPLGASLTAAGSAQTDAAGDANGERGASDSDTDSSDSSSTSDSPSSDGESPASDRAQSPPISKGAAARRASYDEPPMREKQRKRRGRRPATLRDLAAEDVPKPIKPAFVVTHAGAVFGSDPLPKAFGVPIIEQSIEAPAVYRLTDPFVSRSHFSVRFDGERFKLRDAGSLNGTYIRRNLMPLFGERVPDATDDALTLRVGMRVLVMDAEILVVSVAVPPSPSSQQRVSNARAPGQQAASRLDDAACGDDSSPLRAFPRSASAPFAVGAQQRQQPQQELEQHQQQEQAPQITAAAGQGQQAAVPAAAASLSVRPLRVAASGDEDEFAFGADSFSDLATPSEAAADRGAQVLYGERDYVSVPGDAEAAAAVVQPTLVLNYVSDGARHTQTVGAEGAILGSSEICAVRILGAHLSSEHCEIVYNSQTRVFQLRDLSRNDSFRRNLAETFPGYTVRLEATDAASDGVPLNSGDLIRCGHSEFLVDVLRPRAPLIGANDAVCDESATAALPGGAPGDAAGADPPTPSSASVAPAFNFFMEEAAAREPRPGGGGGGAVGPPPSLGTAPSAASGDRPSSAGGVGEGEAGDGVRRRGSQLMSLFDEPEEQELPPPFLISAVSAPPSLGNESVHSGTPSTPPLLTAATALSAELFKLLPSSVEGAGGREERSPSHSSQHASSPMPSPQVAPSGDCGVATACNFGFNDEMQDRVCVVERYGGAGGFFVGVFDGHVNRVVADFAANVLHRNLLTEMHTFFSDGARKPPRLPPARDDLELRTRSGANAENEAKVCLAARPPPLAPWRSRTLAIAERGRILASLASFAALARLARPHAAAQAAHVVCALNSHSGRLLPLSLLHHRLADLRTRRARALRRQHGCRGSGLAAGRDANAVRCQRGRFALSAGAAQR